MPVERIEKIVAGSVVQRAERRNKDGVYLCHAFGTNIAGVKWSSLDEVADYLRSNPRSGVRMNPGWAKVSCHVFIDGVLR